MSESQVCSKSKDILTILVITALMWVMSVSRSIDAQIIEKRVSNLSDFDKSLNKQEKENIERKINKLKEFSSKIEKKSYKVVPSSLCNFLKYEDNFD
mgnify:CR=1 FL=1